MLASPCASLGQPSTGGKILANGDENWRPRYPSTPLPKVGGNAFSVSLAGGSETLKVGRLESIAVRIVSAAGIPVTDAKVQVAARARDVVRFMLTQPRVTKNLGAGKYLVEGLRFNMNGSWLLELEITSGGKTDKGLLELEIR